MSRKAVLIVGVVVVAVLAAGVPLGLAYMSQREKAAQEAAAEDFASAWRAGTLERLTYAGDSPATVAARTQTISGSLTTAKKDLPKTVDVTGVDTTDDRTVARLKVGWTLAGGVPWSYESSLPIRHQGSDWLPDWSPQVVHPQLADTQVLRASRENAPRAEIVGAGDEVLVTEREVVVVGLEPRRTPDVAASGQAIANIVDVDAAELVGRAQKASPSSFVEVITLRRADYDRVRDQLQPIAGAVFQEEQRALAPTATFARALLGSVGSATAEIVKESDGRVRAGDVTGLSGVQRTYDEQLAGTPGMTVKAVTPEGTDSGTTEAGGAGAGETEAEPAADRTLLEQQPKPGTPVKLTLDRATQEAAETSLAAAPKPAALVAVRVGTGEVLAVANGGPNAAGYNRALLGQYPPGSTFKVASALAYLEQGLKPSDTVACPPTIVVSGKTFKNAENEVLGNVPFSQDFAHSCNTAFVGSAKRVSGEELTAAAAALGYGAENTTGVNAFMGEVPASDEPVAHAAAAIGQGKVLASPLAVANATASVAGGRFHPARLVVDPAPGETAAEGKELPSESVTALRTMMRSVVTEGTATVLRSTPGGPVAGKTGTAEFGNDDPPKTHAWFTGWQGDVAVAVVVEDGGFGAETAAPLVKDFLGRLAR